MDIHVHIHVVACICLVSITDYSCIHTVQLRAHSRREGVERKEWEGRKEGWKE